MTTIYVVLETVDLGGSTVSAHYDKTVAALTVEKLNIDKVNEMYERIYTMMKSGRYNMSDAEMQEHAKHGADAYRKYFYVEEVELI